MKGAWSPYSAAKEKSLLGLRASEYSCGICFATRARTISSHVKVTFRRVALGSYRDLIAFERDFAVVFENKNVFELSEAR